MKREEMEKYYNSRFDKTAGFHWFGMNTDRASDYSDERLLGHISQLPLVKTSGFGLVAELCKRFNTILEKEKMADETATYKIIDKDSRGLSLAEPFLGVKLKGEGFWPVDMIHDTASKCSERLFKEYGERKCT